VQTKAQCSTDETTKVEALLAGTECNNSLKLFAYSSCEKSPSPQVACGEVKDYWGFPFDFVHLMEQMRMFGMFW